MRLTLSVQGASFDVKFRAGVSFDVRFLRRNTLPALKELKTCIMAIDPYYRHSNKTERANGDIYDDIFGLHGLCKNIPAL